jgi:hypothetical protein
VRQEKGDPIRDNPTFIFAEQIEVFNCAFGQANEESHGGILSSPTSTRSYDRSAISSVFGHEAPKPVPSPGLKAIE